jgi:small subunit ribosomal protein S4
MSRYTGPRLRVVRALGAKLPGLVRKQAEYREYPPGQHGANKNRKISEFGAQLKEKQKLRLNYGLSERQFQNLMREATKSQSRTDEKLLELLERRLDNVVFRAGFIRTIPGARQFVTHGHIRVNGKRVNIPSYRVRVHDVITIDEKSKKLSIVDLALSSAEEVKASWLEVDTEARSAKVISNPDASSVLFDVNPQLVVEYYSLRL